MSVINFTIPSVCLNIYGHHWECLNNPIFSNLGLCAACWARFMCHHELWPTLVSHPLSSLNSSLGFAGGKHNQKITIAIFRLVLQHFAIPGCFPYILFIAIFSPYFLLAGLLLLSVALFQSRKLVKYMFKIIVNWCRVAVSNDKST